MLLDVRLDSIRAGASGDWRELEAKLRPFVSRHIRLPADAEDVLQDVFLRVQRGLPAIRDEERFGPWIYRVTRSAIVDHVRASSRLPGGVPLPDEEATALSPNDADEREDDRAVGRALAAHLAHFVAQLSTPYREAMTLVELEGLPQKNAAELLGVSLTALKSRVQRGRRLLREALEECCQIALDARGKVVSCEPRALAGEGAQSDRGANACAPGAPLVACERLRKR